jgi:rhamnose utilization protein RhaD (predicted bifunctional aldolase and dehydrogenase)
MIRKSMKSLFDIEMAKDLDELEMRVYTSRLLGGDSDLVLHGGGNTSVKIDDILFVKGSGWDLGSIEKEGFSPAKIDLLLDLLSNDRLSDSDMVKYQREALIDPSAPNPSVEAILHALIPYKFVDHTHADAIVTISNTIDGDSKIEQLFGDRYIIVPYVMPGFILAKKIYEMTREIDWSSVDGMILHNHGVFTFDDDAKVSYENMISTVAKAQEYLDSNAQLVIPTTDSDRLYDLDTIQRVLSEAKGYSVTLKLNTSPLAQYFATQDDSRLYTKGILTPEHIIRTKRVPVVLDSNYADEIESYLKDYEEYFHKYANGEIMLNPAPNWAILKGTGTISIGKNEKETNIIEDITSHTMRAILQGEKIGGYQSISEADSFAMEYWELEQMKLKSN